MDNRLVLKNISIEPSYQGAAAMVELALNGRVAVGQAGSRTQAEDNLSLVGEATVQAVTKFLPTEFGLTLGKVMRAPDVVYAKVDFRSPQETYPLWGIAALAADGSESVAKAVLSALNRRISLLIAG